MSRLDFFTIAIVVICLGAIGTFIYLNYGPDKEKEEVVIEQETTYNETVYEEDWDSESEWDEEEWEDSDTSIDESEWEEEKVEEEEEETTPSYETSGKYMVVAGTFRQMQWAKDQLKTIQKAGYDEARIEKFDRGTYACVLVDRFSNENSARTLRDELKNKGYEASIMVKK